MRVPRGLCFDVPSNGRVSISRVRNSRVENSRVENSGVSNGTVPIVKRACSQNHSEGNVP